MAKSQGRIAAFNPHFERLLNTIRYGTEKDSISLFSSEKYDVNVEIEYVFEDRMLYKITPLNWAVRFNKPALCQFLLKHGAIPHANLVYELYPLHEACCRGLEQIVSIFVEFRCDLNKTTPTDKDTALHIACVRGNVGCVHLLLSANANPNLRNAAGHTPLEAAVYNSQDDLVKLFAAYGISSPAKPVPVTTSSNASPDRKCHSNLSNQASHQPLQRRHSVSSPTSTTPSVVQQLFSSVRPQSHSRPNSVFIGDSEMAFDSRPPSRVSLTSSLCVGSPPTAVISPPKFVESHSPLTRTTAPSISPLAVSLGECVVSDPLLRPSYISQLSVASPSSANSPSPVERDCSSQKSWTSSSRNQNPTSTTGYYYSMPSKFTPQDTQITSATTSGNTLLKPTSTHAAYSCGQQYIRLTDTKHHRSSPGDMCTTVNASPTNHRQSSLSDHDRPKRKQIGIQHATPKDGRGRRKSSLMESTSSPEFPLRILPNLSSKIQDRTRSTENLSLREKTLSIPKATAPVESLTPSPSRERINLLAQCLTSALETLHSSNGGGEPTSKILQKLSENMAETVNLTPEQLSSLVDLALPRRSSGAKSNCPPDHLTEIPLSTEPADHPAEALRGVGLNIDDHPREIRMCDPVPGYMSVMFKLRSSQTGVYDGQTRKSSRKRTEAVKVLVKVYNLRNPVDSNLYHSFDSTLLTDIDTHSDYLKEIDILQMLSSSPHPNVAQLMSHFKADVANQYDRFARQLRPDNQEDLYVTKRVADFLVLSMPCKTVLRYFEDQKSPSFCGVLEKKVLCTLSQVLLAVAHLNLNGISHNSIHAENVFVDSEGQDSVVVSNFGSAVSLDNVTANEISSLQQRLQAESTSQGDTYCRVAPEVREALQRTSFESSVELDDCPRLFETSDSYAAAWMIYELILGPAHKFIQDLQQSCYSYDHVPHLNGLSSLSNHLLKKLFAYDPVNRLCPLEGAIACLVLLFGPHPSQVVSVKDCKEWLLAETVEFYLRPSLKDTSNSDYSDPLSRLLCMYLTLANANPNLVWSACRFFQEKPDNTN